MKTKTTLPTIVEKGEIVLYQPNESICLEVRIEDETVWLTQTQTAELFQTTKQNVSLHINNIFKEGELLKERKSRNPLLPLYMEQLKESFNEIKFLYIVLT